MPPTIVLLLALVSAVWPLEPRPEVAEGFAPPAEQWHAGHRGVDLVGSPGQAVRAARAGTVGFAGSIGGKPVVTVLHGGQRTTYEPVVATVAKGDEVEERQAIGRLVTAGSHCFPRTCLHWGLREGETYLDPLSLIDDRPVRLLPLWRDAPVEADADSRAWVSLLVGLAQAVGGHMGVELRGGEAGMAQEFLD